MRHLITAGFVAAALVAYSLGLEYGSGTSFLVASRLNWYRSSELVTGR